MVPSFMHLWSRPVWDTWRSSRHGDYHMRPQNRYSGQSNPMRDLLARVRLELATDKRLRSPLSIRSTGRQDSYQTYRRYVEDYPPGLRLVNLHNSSTTNGPSITQEHGKGPLLVLKEMISSCRACRFCMGQARMKRRKVQPSSNEMTLKLAICGA